MSDAKAIDALVTRYKDLKKEIGRVIIGQNEVVDQIIISIFSGGQLGKTIIYVRR